MLNDFIQKHKKKIVIASLVAATSINASSIVVGLSVYENIFKRYDLPDYNLYCGEYNLERCSTSMNIESFEFPSDGLTLRGHFYHQNNSKGVVIINHGLHSGEYDYLPEVEFFYENNYDVIAYNYKGTYESDGSSAVGMSESLVDLDHLLDYLETNARFKNRKLFLFGHSWGAFACTAVLSLHKNIAGVASISGFNDAQHLISDKGSQYAGKIATMVPGQVLEEYQKILFKDYYQYTALEGINSCSVPILLAHGENDKTIDINLQSIVAHQSEITNPNVSYYFGTGYQDGHNTILHNDESVIYQKQISDGLNGLKKLNDNNLTYEQKTDYYKNVNHHLYSQLNTDLFRKIITVFDNAL